MASMVLRKRTEMAFARQSGALPSDHNRLRLAQAASPTLRRFQSAMLEPSRWQMQK
jgi:hypothetical protein